MVLADFSVSAGEIPLWQQLHSTGPLVLLQNIGRAKVRESYLIHSLLELLNFG